MTAVQPRRRLGPEVRRAEILEAAAALIAVRGFNGVTLAEIADACGMTNPGLLHYFSSKTELLIAVLNRRDALDHEWVDLGIVPDRVEPDRGHAPMTSDEIRAESRAALTRLVERNKDQRELVRLYTVLSAEALDPTHPAHDYFDQRLANSRRGLAAILAGWHSKPDECAVQILSFMDGVQLNWLRDPSIDLLAEWNRFADMLFAD